nr:immunoglobulin light chain junction region [Macaca mulatta]
YQQYNDLVFTF